MNITAHCIVKDEDRWVWFALQAVLPFVSQVLVFDTGSTDKTAEIIKLINSPKIVFEKKVLKDKGALSILRQEQLKRTQTTWFLLVDGDEVWPEGELAKLIAQTDESPSNIKATFNYMRNCIGDIYHYLPNSTGQYQIAGQKGNLNIRLIKKTPTLKVEGVYPLEFYKDAAGVIQEQPENLLFVDCWYLHTTFLNRSSHQTLSKTSGSLGKSKYPELGISLSEQELPAVFFEKRPEIVGDPLKRRDQRYVLAAVILTPIIYLKRLFS
ncbi:hypothetical protein A2631_02765 [Candidatus Daviesbacteria bacterium RIFCSPHIGHO2_01_FULL_44_29]|uniref:Glycosyltransferase 2-like domain-containing protein n=1 Tax=Candidatus Daviesbacteria bacterium RIFCSPHIGHO2_02_FULL_43_12 TaxID=1797776 RepID=A0A1F5KK42_9BACT|nr:MAG: hypothetical protein A2631_02765 [Candidatus Daviesbacteria bacterium RIFCSPHIGHO2_01_FULL_44_29]OGE40840.1 MAG: hypothetical protein A3E86_02585 [Candidatus Daviesbacteria bacterium RIFCSPHIGHO2_12_FULL_47_45]OGE41306.1 MAG: hypothetical protein A3D25_02160 [Candidatus Daviesbacteria bacterium RIFCSPHIGHO2_02_FULL_43_12]OGE69507.1 MAG: hypothetical protein A3B55_03900 [Candidatus Daviesbacteria bacterium RIFCSPLOWO2_01_FULL_43_15]